MRDHLLPDELSTLARGGKVAGAPFRDLVRHVLHCRPCRRAAANALFPALGRRKGEPAIAPEEDAAYDAAIERAYATFRGALSSRRAEQESVQALAATLEALTADGLDALPAFRREDGVPALVKALLERSWALRHEDPLRMVELAEMAELAVRRLKPGQKSAEQVADLRCRVWAELGNAYRVADRLPEATDAFGLAGEHLLEGSGDKMLLARYMDLISSLYRSRRKFRMACSALTLAYGAYRRSGERHLAGRALINMGTYTGYAGEPEEAIRLIQRGLALIDRRDDEHLTAIAIHNQLWFLVECGQCEEARKILVLNRSQCEEFGGRLSRLKVRWLEGRIDAGLGKLRRAESTFCEVRAEFEAAGQLYDGALAALDLAAALMRQERPAEAREVVLEAAEVFKSLGVEREAMAAVLFLRESFELRIATLAGLEAATSFLRRARYDSSSRFAHRLH